MLTWLMENAATILISLVLVIVVAGIIFSMVRNKKRGKSSCGCSCSGCALQDSCHKGK